MTIPTDVAGVLASHVASGKFSSTDEALRAAVKLLGIEAERRQKVETLRKSLQEADEQIERGEFQDVDEAFLMTWSSNCLAENRPSHEPRRSITASQG